MCAGDGESHGQAGSVGWPRYAGWDVSAGPKVEEDDVTAVVCDIAEEDMVGKDAG